MLTDSRAVRAALSTEKYFTRGCRCVQLFRLHALLACCTLVLLASTTLWSQGTGQGTISGRVSDAQDAALAGAKVTVTNEDTNVILTVLTNEAGYYQLINLNPGNYDILAEAQGFAPMLRKGVALQTEARLSIDMKLGIAGSSQTVEVTASTPLLNTTSGTSVGEVFTTQELENLPAQNESLLALLGPGIISNLPQNQLMVGNTAAGASASQFGSFGRIYANEFSFDGAPNNWVRNIAYSPTVDELGQMATVAGGFDASTGHTYGVALMQSSRAGTNMFHGSADEMYWDYRWEAMQHFQRLNYQYQAALAGCVGKPLTGNCLLIENKYAWPGTHENKVGFGFGGPVLLPRLFNGRNKLFFFVAGMDDNNVSDTSTTSNIPTIQQRSGDFSDLPAATTAAPALFTQACGSNATYYGQYQIYNPYAVTMVSGHPQRAPFCGNKIPSGLISNSSLVKLVNNFWPTPTNSTTTGSNYVYSQMTSQFNHRITGRIDYTPGESDRFFVRYTWMNQVMHFQYFTDINNQDVSAPVQSGSLGWTHVLNAKTILDATLGGVFFSEANEYAAANSYTPSQLGLPSYVDQYAGRARMFPIVQFASGTYAQMSNTDQDWRYWKAYSVRVNLTRVQGAHSMIVGTEWRPQVYQGGGPGNPSGTYSFDDTYTQENDGTNGAFSQSNVGLSYAAFLLGVHTSASATSIPPTMRSTTFYGAFVSDTWRITPKLTLTPGLRFEFEYGPAERKNQQIVGWDPNAALPIAAPANSAYTALYNASSATQQASMPTTLQIQGGPIYAGVNGAPTRQWENNYRFLPRFSLAYQIKPSTVIRLGYGLYFDTLNAIGEQGTIDQDGYTASTSVASSTVFGTDFSVTAPPITNPFPVNNGSSFNTDIGNSAGAMYYAGSTAKIYDHSRVPARMQRGQISVQHQFGKSTMVEVSWGGSFTSNITLDANNSFTQSVGAQTMSYVPASYYIAGTQPSFTMNTLLGTKVTNPFAIGNFASLATSSPVIYNLIAHNSTFTAPTVTLASLVKMYPQMAGLTLYRSIGESKFQSWQVTATRQLSKGFSLVSSLSINDQHDRDWFANAYDANPSWESSNLSRPYRYTARGTYSLPFGKNKTWATKGWKATAFGGFQLSGTYELQPGALLTFPNLFYFGNTAAIPVKHAVEYNNLGLTNGTAYIQGFNTGNVTSTYASAVCTNTGTGFVTNSQCGASTYNARVFPSHIEGVRQEGPNTIYGSVFKTVPVLNKASLNMRMDCFNILNREIVGAANTTPSSAQFGQITGDGTGQGRWIDFQARISF